MSFLDKTTSFTLFQLTNLPDGILGSFGEKLRQYAFMPIDDDTELASCGWASMEDMEDFDFTNGFEINKYFYFAFRVDTRKIAPAVFNRHFELALKKEEQELAKIGKKYIGKERRKEIKEQVRLMLLSKTLPTPAVYDVVWDFTRNIIYFACTNKKIVELFGNYLLQTFGVVTRNKDRQLTFAEVLNNSPLNIKLYQLYPLARAKLLVEDNRELEKLLSEIVYSSFGYNQCLDMNVKKNVLLGEEFLTWLWYRSDNTMPFQLSVSNDTKDYYAVFENNLSIRGSNGENSLQTSLSGNNNPLDEARLGLGTGKKVNNACLVLTDKTLSFIFSLNAKNFSFSSFKILDCKFEKMEFQTLLLEKMAFIEQAMAYFDNIYLEFLAVRLHKQAWDNEVEKIRFWIIKTSKEAQSKQTIKWYEDMGKQMQDVMERM